MRDMMTSKSLGLAVLMAIGFGGAAPAMAATPDFGAWDANRDSMLDQNEFRTGFNDGDWFGDWDGNRDNRLSNEEFDMQAKNWGFDSDDGVFDVWDADDDGFLTNNEYADGAFVHWDRNRDYMLNDDEFDEGINWFSN